MAYARVVSEEGVHVPSSGTVSGEGRAEAGGDPVISALIPLRDRCGDRLENCLRSLRWQNLPATEVEIVLSDFGSRASSEKELRAAAADFDVRVVRTETTELWNRSRALNIGIRKARGKYVLCTDADMIFAPNFLKTLIETQRSHDDRAFVVCRCRDLPESLPEQPWRLEDFPELLAEAPYRKKLGTGACQMATRDFFHSLRGYDEGFKFWGMEDNDMRFRAIRSGLQLDWVHERTAMLHQWHPSDRGKKPLRKFLNDVRFHVTKYKRRKNTKGWG